ncbi:MAG: hypothetical protein GY768_31540 [Planctomycetaceae bacterium]|nr:hypothetical protein [Planctomycetaceae bacterium]
MNRQTDLGLGHRRLQLMMVLGAVSLVVIGQYLNRWPFSQVDVYLDLPMNGTVDSWMVAGVTSSGEINVATLENIDYKILKLYWFAHERAGDRSDRRRIMNDLADYVARVKPPSLQLDGLKIYRVIWGLESGRIQNRQSLNEFSFNEN